MLVKYKGILKIISGIYTRCQQMKCFCKVNSSVRKCIFFLHSNFIYPLLYFLFARCTRIQEDLEMLKFCKATFTHCGLSGRFRILVNVI